MHSIAAHHLQCSPCLAALLTVASKHLLQDEQLFGPANKLDSGRARLLSPLRCAGLQVVLQCSRGLSLLSFPPSGPQHLDYLHAGPGNTHEAAGR